MALLHTEGFDPQTPKPARAPLQRLFDILLASDASLSSAGIRYIGWQTRDTIERELMMLRDQLGPHIHDLSTHYKNWRGAIQDQLMLATTSGEDDLYWKHELKAFDRLFGALTGLPVPTDHVATVRQTLSDRLNEAEAIIRELCDHEGAEGWSADLRARLDRYGEHRQPVTFEQAWAATGYQYGPDALENVELGWNLARGLAEGSPQSPTAAPAEEPVRPETENLFTYQDPERHGITRLARWPGMDLDLDNAPVVVSWVEVNEGDR